MVAYYGRLRMTVTLFSGCYTKKKCIPSGCFMLAVFPSVWAEETRIRY